MVQNRGWKIGELKGWKRYLFTTEHTENTENFLIFLSELCVLRGENFRAYPQSYLSSETQDVGEGVVVSVGKKTGLGVGGGTISNPFSSVKVK